MTECNCTKTSWCDHDLEDVIETAEARGAARERESIVSLMERAKSECVTYGYAIGAVRWDVAIALIKGDNK